MEKESKKLVIFDFDGVLANTIPFCFKQHKENNHSFTLERLKETCLGNFSDGLEKIKKEHGHFVPENFHEKYRNEIEKISMEMALRNMIIGLASKYILAIVSSTPNPSIRKFLIQEGINDYFSDLLGLDVHHNKTIKIDSLLEKYKIPSKNAIFVTDTLGDILEGEKSGVRSIGVTWGLHDRKTLLQGSPLAIVSDPFLLEKSINGVLK